MTTNTKKTQEALRMALDAMNLARAAHGQMLLSDPPQEAWKAWGVSAALKKAMTAASEALAHAPSEREQPAQQEPIAWIYKPHMELLWPDEIEVKDPSKHTGYKPVYTSPPNVPTARASKPWVGLTRDEIADLAEHYYDDKVVQVEEVIEMAEAKLRERNEHWEKNA